MKNILTKQNIKIFFDVMFLPLLTVITACVALFYFFGSSLGWFVMNTDVSAKGMSVSVDQDTSLIIGTTAASVTNITGVTEELRKVTFTDGVSLLKACTYDSKVTKTRLKYPTNVMDVDRATGTLTTSNYTNVTTSDEGVRYVDYQVYIGASNKPLNYNKIDVYFEKSYVKCAADEVAETGITYYKYNSTTKAYSKKTVTVGASVSSYYRLATTYDTYRAISVLIYDGDPDSGGKYVGQIRASKTSYSSSAQAFAKKAGTITCDSPKLVTFRFYIDGNTIDSESGNTYLHSATLYNGIFDCGLVIEAR